ncbi:IS481 family transposase, partial [Streptomyces sp. NPDC057910]
SGLLVNTFASPIEPSRRSRLAGARAVTTRLPPPPSQPPRAIRKVPADGITMVSGHRLRVGRQYAGKTVTIVIEDTVFRVLDGDTELATHPRKNDKPVHGYRTTYP